MQNHKLNGTTYTSKEAAVAAIKAEGFNMEPNTSGKGDKQYAVTTGEHAGMYNEYARPVSADNVTWYVLVDVNRYDDLPKKAKAPSTAYGIFTEDGLDGTCYGLREAKREAKDLKEMVHAVKVVEAKGPDAEQAFDDLHEMVRHSRAILGTVTPKMVKEVATRYPATTFKLGVH